MEKIEGRVGIPNSYFLKMAKHDYEDYTMALPREFYQNSIDAGATRIDVKFINGSPGVIIVEDDGCGMDLNTLENKLLVLGGSKKGEDAVGAFGKAKEILFFSWERYTIHTGNLIVQGEGAEYSISTIDKHFKGTRCTIKVGNKECYNSLATNFIRVAGLTQTKTKIYVDGDEIKCTLKRGRAVRDVEDIGTIYQLKKTDNVMMAVRINGIWMFNQYVGHGMGTLVMELSKKSVDVLTSNRDGFKWETRYAVSRLVEDLQVNKGAALKKNAEMKRSTIKGSGKVIVGSIKDTLKAISEGMSAIAAIDRIISSEATYVQKERMSSIAKSIHSSAIEVTDAEKVMEFIGYEPDFDLLYESNKEESVERFMKTKKAKLLAIMWTEIIKQVMLDNKRYLKFTAGFVFEKEVEAKIVKEGDDIRIYLNPKMIKTSDHRRVVMECLKDLAIHELAHLRYQFHDNDFVNEMADLRKATYYNNKPYYEIQRTKV